MLKAIIKSVFSIFFLLTLIGLTGCSTPDEKKAAQIAEAVEMWSAGDSTGALTLLEELSASYPNDPEILQQIGNIYASRDDSTMAAFYLEQAHRQNPADAELLLQTYRAQADAGDSAAATASLETLAKNTPNSLSAELWRELGQRRAAQNRTEAALEAYLNGVDPNAGTPPSDAAVAIGTLFKQLDNLPQAERWFKIAAGSDDAEAMTALLNLLEINLRNQQWSAAEANLEALDAQFPGAVDASKWANTRADLQGLRDAQNEMRARLERTRAAKEAAEKATAETAQQQTQADEAAGPGGEPPTETATTSNGKAQSIADANEFAALADTPAEEPETPAPTETPDAPADPAPDNRTSAVAFNPEIAIQPADPDLSFAVSFDQQNAGAGISYRVENTPPSPVPPPKLAPEPAPQPLPAAPTRPERPRDIESILSDAGRAEVDRDFPQAIGLYWQALGLANDRADIWNLLSRAYLVANKPKNAETTALEAIRLAPDKIDYTLDYLRIVQRTKPPADFIAELETAYDRFPRNPEITLSLARAYDRLSNNRNAAATLYQRFIDLAPNHPLRSEADSALRRVR